MIKIQRKLSHLDDLFLELFLLKDPVLLIISAHFFHCKLPREKTMMIRSCRLPFIKMGFLPVLENYIHHIQEELELQIALSKDTAGFYPLHLSSSITLFCKELFPGILIHSTLTPAPQRHKEALFTYLMKANFLGLSTAGAAIGMDAEEKFLTLSRIIPYDINYKTFKEAVEDFTNFLELWRNEIERYLKTASEGIL